RAFVQVLIDGLASRRAPIRFSLAHGLDTFGDEHCRPHLIALMEDPVPRVRWMAMHALSCHACGEKPEALEADVSARIARAAVHDPSIRVRRNAVVALGLAGAGAELLRDLAASDADFKVRRNAEWALSKTPRSG
ncbi:MAG TPA: HEAT repeat domain-containing protein, partial [Caulobacteraceae bacterium]